MLGWLPDKHFFKFAHSYRQDQGDDPIGENPEPIDIKIGLPVGPYDTVDGGGSPDDNVFKRQFANGLVYVNMEPTSQNVTLARPYHDWSDGTKGSLHKKGAVVSIASEDALFLLKPPGPAC